MKKLLVFMLILALMLAGCGTNGAETEELQARIADLQIRIMELEDENEALRQQLENFKTAQLEANPTAELVIWEWSMEENMLTVNGAFARVMNLPMEGDAPVTPESCAVVITHNDEEIFRETWELFPGEADNSLERQLEFFGTELPAMEDGDILDVYLEVIMPDGTVVTSWGAAWDYAQGKLSMNVG